MIPAGKFRNRIRVVYRRGLIEKLSALKYDQKLNMLKHLLADCRSFRISPVIITDRSKEPITIHSEDIAIAFTISTPQLNMMG